MTANDFSRSLEAILANMTPAEILQLPGAYSALADALSEEAFSHWREAQLSQRRPQTKA